MSKIAFPVTLLATVLAGLLPAAPAQATGAPRTFLSAAGSDSNGCTSVTTPCRHMAAAFTATAQDGEIYVLDPANYGSLTITHGVSIEGHGWASIAPVANNPAITINANPGDKINIIGVVLDGTAVTNTAGIVFNSGGSLIVRDSVIRNFTGDGIEFPVSAAALLSVSNTLISDNGSYGISIAAGGTAAVTGVVDHVAMEHNGIGGLHVQSSTAQTIKVTVSYSVSANNANNGIDTSAIGAAVVDVTVQNCTLTHNGGGGVSSSGSGSTIRMTRTTSTQNGDGWFISSGGVVTSYADNTIDGNLNNNSTPASTAVYH